MTGDGVAGDAARRADLLCDVDDGGTSVTEWLWPPHDAPDRGRTGEVYGFDPSFTHLVSALAANPRDDAGKAFLKELLAALPARADTAAAVRRWRSETTAADVVPALVGTPAADGAGAIIGLVRESVSEQVPRKTWRAAKSRVSAVHSLSEDASDHAKVALELAWDLDRVPGAAADMVWSLSRAIAQSGDRCAGWTTDMGQELNELQEDIRRQASAELDQTDHRETLIEAFREAHDRLSAASARATELMRRYQDCSAHGSAQRDAWLHAARARLISEVTR